MKRSDYNEAILGKFHEAVDADDSLRPGKKRRLHRTARRRPQLILDKVGEAAIDEGFQPPIVEDEDAGDGPAVTTRSEGEDPGFDWAGFFRWLLETILRELVKRLGIL